MMTEQDRGDGNGDKKVTANPAGDGGAGRGDKLAFRMQSSHEGDH